MTQNIILVRKLNPAVILISFFGFLNIRLFGSLVCPFEIFATLYFFLDFFIENKKVNIIFQNDIYKIFSKLLILWFSCQLISDIVNKTDFKNSLKGTLAPILILVGIRFLVKLYDYFNYKYFLEDFLVGLVLHNIYFLLVISESLEFAIKMGCAVSLGIINYSLIKNRNINSVVSLILISISFIYGARSALTILTLFMLNNLFFKDKSKADFNLQLFPNIIKGISKYFIILIILFSLSPLFNLSNKIISSLNPDKQRSMVLERQSKSKSGVFSARIEYFSLLEVIKDSPFLGHGSWALDEDYKYSLIAQRENLEYADKTDRFIINQLSINNMVGLDYPYIPSHSFIQQTVIWAGLFAPFFFLYLLNLNWIIIRNLEINYAFKLMFILNIWNIFFSPLGDKRFSLPLICFISIFCLLNKEQSKIYLKNKNSYPS